jgi:hypothetical protein
VKRSHNRRPIQAARTIAATVQNTSRHTHITNPANASAINNPCHITTAGRHHAVATTVTTNTTPIARRSVDQDGMTHCRESGKFV